MSALRPLAPPFPGLVTVTGVSLPSGRVTKWVGSDGRVGVVSTKPGMGTGMLLVALVPFVTSNDRVGVVGGCDGCCDDGCVDGCGGSCLPPGGAVSGMGPAVNGMRPPGVI